MANRFETTRWSLVQASGDRQSPGHGEALAELCRSYWPAVYAYVCARGTATEEAQELTQGFFTHLLSHGSLRLASPERGKFRSFLLASARHYIANEWHRANREKRGGKVTTLQLDFGAADHLLGPQGVEQMTPEKAFERRWALSVLRRTMIRLEQESTQQGKGALFLQLKPFLLGEAGHATYRDPARALDMSEAAVRVAAHRMRRRFGILLREEIGDTLSDPAHLDDELRYLMEILGS